MTHASWRPILPDGLRQEAVRAIADVRDDLVRTPPDFDVSGEALLHTYLWLAEGHASDREHAIALLEEGMTRVPHFPALYSGFCGSGWLTAHLSKHLVEAEPDVYDDIDTALETLLTRPEAVHFDLINGLVGFGVYSIERVPARRAATLLELIVARLDECSCHEAGGLAWPTLAAYMTDMERSQCRDASTLRNLGVAHGIPGVIAMLAAAHDQGVPRAEDLLRQAVHWFVSLCGDPKWNTGLPHAIGDGVPQLPGRLAWCYGDAGIAVTLFAAARSLRDSAGRDIALAIARRAARRATAEAGVVDAGLCHGSAGLAHLFNRLFQATGEAGFRDASIRWFEHALSVRRPGDGIGGFLSWTLPQVRGRPVHGDLEWVADRAFLTGATGIALALLAAISEVEPSWDALLLANLRGPCPSGSLPPESRTAPHSAPPAR